MQFQVKRKFLKVGTVFVITYLYLCYFVAILSSVKLCNTFMDRERYAVQMSMPSIWISCCHIRCGTWWQVFN